MKCAAASLFLAATSAFALPACAPSPVPESGGATISHTFPALEVGPHEERQSDCQSWTIGNEAPLYVNAVEMSAGPAWHHANWLYVPESMYPGPDGTWPCSSRDFDEVQGGLTGGVLFAQSTQSTGETQQFPAGAGVAVPARSRLVARIHLVNASEEALSTALTLTLRHLPESRVEVRLRPLVTSYFPLELPPQQESVFTARCDMAGPNGGAPIDFGVYYVLPHYHGWGTGFSFGAGGPSGPITVYDRDTTGGEPWGLTLDPPVDLTGATSIEFACRYHNTTTAPLYWGNSEGEMCMMLAYTSDTRRWLGGAVEGPNMVVGTDAEGAVLNEAPCTMTRL